MERTPQYSEYSSRWPNTATSMHVHLLASLHTSNVLLWSLKYHYMKILLQGKLIDRQPLLYVSLNNELALLIESTSEPCLEPA